YTIKKTLRFSRSTYFRRKKALSALIGGAEIPSRRPKRLRAVSWGEPQLEQILQIRRKNPTYGKAKISVVLRRNQGPDLSESTVGRMLKVLSERGLVQKSASAPRKKKERIFDKHAQPWTFKDYRTMVMGERVQTDHMTVEKNGSEMKEFHAWERKSKHLSAGIFEAATAENAKKFLMDFYKKAPFRILSVQVDGESEFRAEFEEACRDLKIPLIVLPPAKPKYNGGVERSNRTLREEFWVRDFPTLPIDEMNDELQKYVEKYNNFRPHNCLHGMTPMEYINSTYGRHGQSHMS
ncbi:MAG: integrase core domain-containing protein, partial [Holosporaceae bacterium]|nr:integrase core domain-containing protein [Holosporaceae bacterium]